MLKFSQDGHDYQVYATTNSLKCFSCGRFGHLKWFCPKNKEQAENPTTAVPPVEENVGDEISSISPWRLNRPFKRKQC